MPDATSGRTEDGGFLCTDSSADFNPCVDAEIELARPARVLVIGEGDADSGSTDLVRVSTCQIFVDGAPIGVDRAIAAGFQLTEQFKITAISDVILPGTRAVEMACHGPGGGAAPRILFPTLTTVVLGAG